MAMVRRVKVVLGGVRELDTQRYAPIATSEKAPAPPQEAGLEFDASADQSLASSQQDSEEIFYTPASSPTSSMSPAGPSPSASRSQTPAHTPSLCCIFQRIFRVCQPPGLLYFDHFLDSISKHHNHHDPH